GPSNGPCRSRDRGRCASGRAAWRQAGGWRGSARRALAGVLDVDEVSDLPQDTGELRALRALRDLADPAEPERAQGAAMGLRLPDRAARLRDPELRHYCFAFVFSA